MKLIESDKRRNKQSKIRNIKRKIGKNDEKYRLLQKNQDKYIQFEIIFISKTGRNYYNSLNDSERNSKNTGGTRWRKLNIPLLIMMKH